MNRATQKSVRYGFLGALAMLSVYFLLVSLMSGWPFAQSQFKDYWGFIVSLAAGFGIQIGLYSYLRSLVKSGQGTGKVLGITGTTSTAAMIACCAHYLVNILPVLGAVGVVTIVAQYQIEFFWLGLVLNLAGIIFILNRLQKVRGMSQ